MPATRWDVFRVRDQSSIGCGPSSNVGQLLIAALIRVDRFDCRCPQRFLRAAGRIFLDHVANMFVVSAVGPTGVFWLSEPAHHGLRTLVIRNQADHFPTLEAARSAINKMATGYKLARVSFEIELSGLFPPRAVPRHAHPVTERSFLGTIVRHLLAGPPRGPENG